MNFRKELDKKIDGDEWENKYTIFPEWIHRNVKQEGLPIKKEQIGGPSQNGRDIDFTFKVVYKYSIPFNNTTLLIGLASSGPYRDKYVFIDSKNLQEER